MDRERRSSRESRAVADVRPVVSTRKVKNQHGTRVARRIVCADCGRADTLDFVPRDAASVLCRRCAFEKLGVVDPDRAELRLLTLNCHRCGTITEVDARRPIPDEVICDDCRSGIETRQGDRSRRGIRTAKGIVISRARRG